MLRPADKGWAPTALLSFLTEAGILKGLKVSEAIIGLGKQTNVRLPEDCDQGCTIIGKSTQGSKARGKRLTRRLVTYPRQLTFLVRHPHERNTCWHPPKVPIGAHLDILCQLSPAVSTPEGVHVGVLISTWSRCGRSLSQTRWYKWQRTACMFGRVRCIG